MNEEIKRYEIKLDNPSAYHNMYILEENIFDEKIEICAKVEVRDNIFTEIKLNEVDPKNLINGKFYFINSADDIKYKKTQIISDVMFNKSSNCLTFQGKIFGEGKPLSRGVVNFHIPLDLNRMKFYKLEIIGNYNERQ